MENNETFEYLGKSFQYRLLKQLLSDHKFANNILDILNPNYFEDEYLRKIALIIKEVNEESHTIPDTESIKIRINEDVQNEFKRKFYVSHIDNILKADNNDHEFVRRKAFDFCRQQELKKALTKATDIVDKGKSDSYDTVVDIVQDALETGKDNDDVSDVFEDIDSVISDDYREPIGTKIEKLDEEMDGGLAKTELGVILAALGVGKAQPLHSKILTPDGWKTMGDIKIGDEVIGSDGVSTKVVGTFPQGVRPIYRVKFRDGTETLCDEEHLWSVNEKRQRDRNTKKNGKNVTLPPDNTFKVKKTKDMIGNIKVWNDRVYNYKIPSVEPVDFNEKNVSVDPYLMGIMIGDGHFDRNTFTTKDDEIIDNIDHVSDDFKVYERKREVEKEVNGQLVLEKRELKEVSLIGIRNKFKELGFNGIKSDNKFIPHDYLYNSLYKRNELLKGLVDSDGHIHDHRIEIITKSERLANDIKELVMSLGGDVTIRTKDFSYTKNGDKYDTGMGYRVYFSLPDNGVKPSKIERKLNRFVPRKKYSDKKYIESIEYYGEEEAKCIMVNNNDGLYVTDDYIVTHNTSILTKIANAGKEQGKNVLHIFFEDQTKAIQRKHLSCWTNIDLNDLKHYPDLIKEVVDEKKSQPGELKLKKFNSAGVTVPKIKQYIRKLMSQGFEPDMVVIDYIDCVNSTKNFSNDDIYQSEGDVMRELESMLSELDVAGWTAIQGNRSSLDSEVVEASQVGGSIKKAQIGHFIMSVAKSLEQKEFGRANVAILKSRFGRDGLTFNDITFENSKMNIHIPSDIESRTFLEEKKLSKDKEKQKVQQGLESHRQNNNN